MNANDSAFPISTDGSYMPGMSIRAYFAGQALASVIAVKMEFIKAHLHGEDFTPKAVAESCCQYADALISELSKKS